MICQTLLASVEYDYRDISNGEMLGSGAGGDVLKVDLKDKTGIGSLFISSSSLTFFKFHSVAVKHFHVCGYERSLFDSVRMEIIVSSHLKHKNICEMYGACLQYPVSVFNFHMNFSC
jgi:hypothetical protein